LYGRIFKTQKYHVLYREGNYIDILILDSIPEKI